MARFAVVLVRPMIARLGIALGSLCLVWIMAGSGLAGAQPWQPRDPGPPPNLPAATGLTHADEAAMRLLIEAQIAAMRADDWPSAFALESPDLQAQYGAPAALSDDVIAHYAPFPAIDNVRFLDIVTFRGLPTYRVTLADGEGATTIAYYLVRRLDDGSLRIAVARGIIFWSPQSTLHPSSWMISRRVRPRNKNAEKSKMVHKRISLRKGRAMMRFPHSAVL